jgi:hypothetical protein
MKRNMLFVVLLVGMTLTVKSAFGQSTARVRIPFDFSIGSSALPAGEYTVSALSAENDAVLAIRSLDGGHQMFVQTISTESGKTSNENRLIFHRYGDQYFLSQIWVGGQAVGRMLPVSNREREMAHRTIVQEASILGK